jgi:uncharacterized repeat protein (TIGR03809 family)
MTTSFDALRYQRALERWRALAERRLAYITDLYETGRWQRYFSEREFLRMVRETRAAVETWQRLVPDPAPSAQVLPLTAAPSSVRGQMPTPSFTGDAWIERQRSVA